MLLLTRSLSLCGLLLAGLAAAGARPGDILYIKARNTRVLKDPSASAAVVVILQPGAPVTWQGPHPKDKRWQKVAAGGKQGVVMSANLSVEPPRAEVTAATGAAAADVTASASSGAASKALGPGAIAYAETLNAKTAARQLQRAEALARTVGPREVSEHARKAGLREMVGASAGVAEARP
ncbi:MAG TPA: SH3 domain-containing protein [Myxococcales bacterium]|jgi:hypothetical protein|nr:SH3 domain-containing protein [Myxococcales bacterium]